MLNQVLNTTLRVLFFRAGPQDFPYLPQLSVPIALGATLANAAIFATLFGAPMALLASAALVAGLALVTQSVLRVRNLANRYHQTFHALLATTTVMNLMALPALLQLAPLFKLVAEHPELLEQPQALHVPEGAVLIYNLINIWNFAVTAWIFRNAADTRLAVGVLIALMAALAILFVALFAGTLAAALGGGGAPAT